MNYILRKAAFAALAVAGAAAQVPLASADVTVGGTGSNNAYPFNAGDMRYQQVYDAAAFSGAITIYGLRFEVAQDGTGNSFDTTLSSVIINLSTTSAAVGSLSTTFADNAGGDNTTVLSGALHISSAGGSLFDIAIPFATSFSYNPGAGNLLADFQLSGPSTSQFEAGFSSAVQRVWAYSAGATTGFTDPGFTYGLDTQFVTSPFTTPVPEPESYAMLLAGLALLAFLRRRGMPRA